MRIYNSGLNISNGANHSHNVPLHKPPTLIMLNETPAETHPAGDFGPPQTDKARKLSNSAKHTGKPGLHNPKAENKPQPAEPFFPVDNIANIAKYKRKTVK